ncbi:GNAT family N-acetyltransferase [Bulleidia sp. zg-1006]|uniref:GNAT family N-acetyltransferase n=1 Tax=Bulleidia sp. zg-1006 TaxID=2806552 RepID=UPI00193970D2|nr:GNAT family N-acetyltransferase [Bulleidia sp. zg-1006]QRG86905.1 GNAT family N-acetyltransferase [Bulleidia sp. zg-1006]
MEFRLAILADLPQLKKVYKGIIQEMNKQNIEIWDEIYPCEFFAEDIREKQLFVLVDKDEIVSAFALTKKNIGETSVEWEKRSNKVFYLDRLGVNKKYFRKGIGNYMLNKAKDISKSFGAEYLRLFVVDINKPAINLYTQSGFNKAKGIYEEKFDDGFVLHEFGYEIKL